jgi:hypothetical protein
MEIVLKQAKLNDDNLSINTLHDNINNIIKKRNINNNIKGIMDIYERSTAPTETEQSEPEYNPTLGLIRFLISRNREDATFLKLKHFKNIKCNSDNNKSCIIPIYKIPESREYIKDVKNSNLVVETLNCKYAIFIRDIYNITYKNLLERMENRYKINVGFFKE